MEEKKKEYVGLTAEELTSLGFVLEDGEVNEYHRWWYYILDIGDFCMITNVSDEIDKCKFSVQVFDYHDEFVFTDFKQLKNFINILKETKRNDETSN